MGCPPGAPCADSPTISKALKSSHAALPEGHVEEIAHYLGISRDTVYSWVGKTDIPVHKVGRLWKFKTDEIDAWVRKKNAVLCNPWQVFQIVLNLMPLGPTPDHYE
jgi:excisionase family DNA binding protein